MKKNLFLLIVALLGCVSECIAQNSGLGFNYQAVVRKADGSLLANSDVTLRVSLSPGQTANPTWVEIHKVKTDASGCFGITVGKGARQSATGVASRYSDINFAAVYYWMKIELQEGNTYRVVSHAQLPSSPYSEMSQNGMLPGMIIPFAGPTSEIPKGWLLCDGRAVSRSEYPKLFNAIKICWGEGNGSTTFNIPDLRGMFLRGVAGDSDNDPDKNARTALKSGGNTRNDVGSYQEDAIRNITGRMWGGRDKSHMAGTTAGAFKTAPYDKYLSARLDGDYGYSQFVYLDASLVVPTGADNRPKNVYVNYIIKY